jgi:Ca2+-binding RTX toxin-like protein
MPASTIFALDGDSVGDEDANGTVIGRLGNIGSALPLTYTLVDNAGGRFRIVGSVLQIADTGLIDAKVDVAHSITVRAVDSDGVSHDQTFVLVVEDQNAPPKNVELSESLVAHLALTGERVGVLTAVDPEEDDVTFTLVDDADGRFAIDPDNPTALVVANPTKLDFAEAPKHEIVVRATDETGNFVDTRMEIQLEDPLAILRRDGPSFDENRYQPNSHQKVVYTSRTSDGNTIVIWGITEEVPFGQGVILAPPKLMIDVVSPTGAVLSSNVVDSDTSHDSAGFQGWNSSEVDPVRFNPLAADHFEVFDVPGGFVMIACLEPFHTFEAVQEALYHGFPGEIRVYQFNDLGQQISSVVKPLVETRATFPFLMDDGFGNEFIADFLGAGSSLFQFMDAVRHPDGTFSLLLARNLYTSSIQASDFTDHYTADLSMVLVTLDQSFMPVNEAVLFSWSTTDFRTAPGVEFAADTSEAVALANGGTAALITLGTGSTSNPDLGNFLVGITDDTGALVGTTEIARQVGSLGGASIAALPDGGFVVGQFSFGTTFLQLFDAFGTPLADPFSPPGIEGIGVGLFTIDGLGFGLSVYDGINVSANVVHIFDGDGQLIETTTVQNGKALRNDGPNSLNNGNGQNFESTGGAEVIIESATGDSPADSDGDGDLDLSGEFTIGLSNFSSAMLRVEGAAEVFADRIIVKNSIVHSGLGDVAEPLFRGTFTIDRRTGIASDFTGASLADSFDLGGLDVVWKGLRLTTGGAAFDTAFALPTIITDGAAPVAGFALPNAIPDATLNGVLNELFGPNALRFTDAGVKLGAGKVTLGTFNVPSFFGLFSAEAKSIVVRYDDTLNLLAIDGELKVKSEIIGSELSQLGIKDTALTFKNLLIKDGKVSIEGALSAKNVEVSPSLALKDLAFNIKVVEDTLVSISAQGTIDFLKSGSDIVFAGEVLRPPLALNKLTLGVSDLHQPLRHGFFLEKVIGTIDHLAPAPPESPSVPTTLTGTIGLSWGQKLSLTLPQFLGGAAIEGSAVTIDIAATYDMGNIITGSVTGTIIAPEFATIVGQVSYDVPKATSTLAGTFNYFDGTITGSATTTINEKGQTALGTAQLNIPNIALFGPGAGMNLTNVNYFLTVTLDGNHANDLVASWTQLTLPNPITGGTIPVTVGFQVALDGSVKLISGANDIPKTNSFDVGGNEDWLMITANWDNAATAHVATRVRTPENTFIQEADYAANGIFIVEDLGSPTKLTIIIDDPRAGNWDLQVIDPVGQGLGTVEYMGLSPDPAPTFSIDELVTVLGDDTVTISSFVEDTDGPPQVYYFFDDNASGFDGYAIGTLVPLSTSFDFLWDVTGVTRGEYFVYGATFDGENAPVFDYSDDSVFVAHRPTALTLDGTEVGGNGPHVSISEASAAGTKVGTLGAIDVDAGESFSFALVDSAGGRFVLDGTDLKVSPGALLDADLDFGYTVTVRITDQDGLTFDQDIRVGMIDVAGDASLIEGTANADNLTGTSGTDIFVATGGGNDKVDGEAGDDLIVYAGRRSDYLIEEGDTTDSGGGGGGGGGYGGYGDPPPPPAHPSTVTITDLRPGGPDGRDLVVKVEVFRFADGNYTREQLFAPDSIALSDSSITENSGIGTVVGSLTATDPQAGDSLTFSLHSNPGDLFALDGTDLVLAAPLDFESAQSHDIVVRVTDAAGHHLDRTFTIAVSNVGGVSIRGTLQADVIDATHTVAGQPLPTAEEDTINGRTGADTMAAGLGNDRYFVDHADDVVTEAVGEGLDKVYAAVDTTLQPGSEIENLYASVNTGLTLTGNEFNNRIYGGEGIDELAGGDGADTLNGKAGADAMAGGAGNDRYFVDDAGDTAIEIAGEGADTVYADVDYALQAGSEIESLRANVDTGLTLTGNELSNSIMGGAGADVLAGGAGADTLNGKAGADEMAGGADNDRYFVDDAGDIVAEAAGEGADTVYAEVDYALQAGSEIESLRANTDTGLTLTGNELNNGLMGGAGADILSGGGGTDVLTGKGGDDAFHFAAPAGLSKISDFQSGEDVLQISASGFGHGLVAGTSAAVVNAASASAASHVGADGYFIFDNTGGGLGTLYWDATGGNGADALAIAKLAGVASLAQSDFQLV